MVFDSVLHGVFDSVLRGVVYLYALCGMLMGVKGVYIIGVDGVSAQCM